MKPDNLNFLIDDLSRSNSLGPDKFAREVAQYNRATNHHLSQPYAVVTTSASKEAYDVDLTVPQMRALICGRMESFLVHGMMRLMKRADVTIPVLDVEYDRELYNACRSIQSRIRIISNGREGIALLE